MEFSSFDPIVSFPLPEPRATNDGGASSPLPENGRFDQHLRDSSRPDSKQTQATRARKPDSQREADERDEADHAPAGNATQPTEDAASSDQLPEAEEQNGNVIDKTPSSEDAVQDTRASTTEIANAGEPTPGMVEVVGDRQPAAELPTATSTDEPTPEVVGAAEPSAPSESQSEQHTEGSPEHAVLESNRDRPPLDPSEAVTSNANDRADPARQNSPVLDQQPKTAPSIGNGPNTAGKAKGPRRNPSDRDQDVAGDEPGPHQRRGLPANLQTESDGWLATVQGVPPVQRRTHADANTAGHEPAASEPPPAEAVESRSSGVEGAQDGKSAPVSTRPLMQMVGKGADPTSDRSALSGPDQARFLHRVTRAAEIAHNRGGPIRLRLSPPELGSLQLEIRVNDGVLTARIEVEAEFTRNALLENSNTLRERLAEQGIRVEQFDVNLTDRQTGSAPDGRYDQQEQTPNSIDRPKPETQENETETHDEQDNLGVPDGNEQLDVVI